jgi:hypothetical protein
MPGPFCISRIAVKRETWRKKAKPGDPLDEKERFGEDWREEEGNWHSFFFASTPFFGSESNAQKERIVKMHLEKH